MFFSKKITLSAACFVLALSIQAQPDGHKPLRQGDKMYDNQNYSDAEKKYDEAVKEAPKNAVTHYNKANAVYRQGRYGEAVTAYQLAAAAAKDPAEKSDVFHNLGNAHMQQKQWGEAVKAYEQSLRLQPNKSETKTNLQLAKRKLLQQQQQQKEQEQEQQQEQQQKKQQQQQEEERQKRMSKQQASQMLNNAVGPQDQKNAQKYRENKADPVRTRSKKDW